MDGLRLLWGDLHNHNEIGYAQGSLERSYDIARSHLDFYAFTPHGQNTDGQVVASYPVVDERWPEVQAAARRHDRPGEFTTFLGYEWHSGPWGHVHVVYADDDQPLRKAPTMADLQQAMRGRRVLLVPHHTAYRGGVDWEALDPELSPLIEIFSEHGSSERDGGPHPMLGHSGGPGDARFTVQHGLALGHRLGFTAGTDNHDGYPGGHGLGLTGVWARQNTRESIFEALRARRTVAVTGDRIEVEIDVDGAPMGGVVSPGTMAYAVRAWDALLRVDAVVDGLARPLPLPPARAPTTGPYRLRLEYGWGPMKGYGVYDWEGCLRVDGGRLRAAVPAFVSDPFDESRRKRVDALDETEVRWRSHTSRGGLLTTRNGVPYYAANDALCLEIEGDDDTRLDLELRNGTSTSLLATQPDWSLTPRRGRLRQEVRLGDLLAGRRGWSMEEGAGSVVLHRALPEARTHLRGEVSLAAPGCCYLRVMQENGQMAWTSPVWVE